MRKSGVMPDPVTPTPTLADIPVVKAFVVRYPREVQREIIKRAKARLRTLFDEPRNMLAVLTIADELNKAGTLNGDDIDWYLDGEFRDAA